jgi:hypothetical protein
MLAVGLPTCLASAPAAAISDLSDSIYRSKIHPQEVKAIEALLPEREVNSAFTASSVDPNLRLREDAGISVTFITEGAGYKNSFGYFLFDEDNNILSRETIFANASMTGGGGSLRPGDTVDLGVFEAGTNIGFWLQGNGYNDPNGHTYYTLDQFNPDGKRHVAIMADVLNERIVLGIEDLFNLGDRDFNDVVFTFEATPFSALDIAGMPTGAPEAGPIATAMISAGLFGAFARRRGRRHHARVGSGC